jgi:hypothetical protein
MRDCRRQRLLRRLLARTRPRCRSPQNWKDYRAERWTSWVGLTSRCRDNLSALTRQADYCAISGFGRSGTRPRLRVGGLRNPRWLPRRVMSEAGCWITGRGPAARPVIGRNRLGRITDINAGMLAASAARGHGQPAYVHRTATGAGQFVTRASPRLEAGHHASTYWPELAAHDVHVIPIGSCAVPGPLGSAASAEPPVTRPSRVQMGWESRLGRVEPGETTSACRRMIEGRPPPELIVLIRDPRQCGDENGRNLTAHTLRIEILGEPLRDSVRAPSDSAAWLALLRSLAGPFRAGLPGLSSRRHSALKDASPSAKRSHGVGRRDRCENPGLPARDQGRSACRSSFGATPKLGSQSTRPLGNAPYFVREPRQSSTRRRRSEQNGRAGAFDRRPQIDAIERANAGCDPRP